MNTATQAVPAAATKIITVDVRPDKVAVLVINDQAESMNTITVRFGTEFGEAIERVERDDGIVAAVIRSGKRDFVVGANVDMLKSIKLAADAERMSRELAQGLARIKGLRKPVVAAVNGQALGGGFELALACHAIVLSDDKKTAVGLPEVQLGLMPGANGLLRIAERAGLQVALDLGLTGKNVRPSKAKKLGLCDEVCPQSVLVEAACSLAKELAKKIAEGKEARVAHAPKSLGKEQLATLALEDNPLGRKLLFKKAREQTRKKTHGHYPATERILDVLECYGGKGFGAAAELEAKSFGELVVSETAHRLIEVFFATTALKKDPGTDDVRAKALPVEQVVMLGGGLMGGGIAYVTINAGIPVRLKDKDDDGVGRGLKYVGGILDERVKKRQLRREERDQIFARLTATTDYTGMKHADVVIEAVFEDLALKQKVLRDVEAITSDKCIFASNTSSIPITKIAEASKHPETVVGMHYFSPVHKMPLLEVIQHAKTDSSVVATAVAIGKKQGKTVIVVKDGVGFYTSRILGPYINEASHILAEGVPVEAIDAALIDWGWPIGPIQLLDEVGIDVAAHVGEIVHEAFGDRLVPPGSMDKLIADNRKGRKNERGFYLYGKDALKHGGKRQVDPTIYKTLGIEPVGKLPAEEIQMRASLAFVNEALLCFGEGLLRSPRDGDIGAIFGLGFPPFRGGPFRYVDTIGAAETLRRIRGYEDRFGKRWTPAPVLLEMAKKGERFYVQ
jgi:3-hydroxyacyl-CoA dehydrogenase/enoyl-CoA hydratase/3-hydroxybutyryl-CoA epimerase